MTQLTIVQLLLLSGIFVIGYACITFGEGINLNKAYTATFTGTLMWIILVCNEGEKIVGPVIKELGGDIFGLLMFLLSAMALIQILTHYRFFDYIKVKILELGLSQKKLFWVIGTVTFFLSAIIDNMTAALVIVSIALCFTYGKNLYITAAAIVIAANAGGASTPIGDVTTFMLWTAGKYTSMEVIVWATLPAITMFVLSLLLLMKKLEPEKIVVIKKEEPVFLSRTERCVIITAFISFTLSLVAHEIGVPAYIGLFFGFATTGVLISVFHNIQKWKQKKISGLKLENSHSNADIEKLLTRTDVATIIFFAGILLAVGALNHAGILEWLSNVLLGAEPALYRLFIGTGLLGLLSSIVDNIPLLAASMDIIKIQDPAIWSLLAYTVGTGGSIFIIGSAAGVVTMGKVEGLSFYSYAKIAAFPAFVGYTAGMLVWLGQYYVFPMISSTLY